MEKSNRIQTSKFYTNNKGIEMITLLEHSILEANEI